MGMDGIFAQSLEAFCKKGGVAYVGACPPQLGHIAALGQQQAPAAAGQLHRRPGPQTDFLYPVLHRRGNALEPVPQRGGQTGDRSLKVRHLLHLA